MKKVFDLEELDCANCAAKMERAIAELEGVNSATVNFMTQRLTLEVEDNMLDEVLERAAAIIKRIEPDCRIRVKK